MLTIMPAGPSEALSILKAIGDPVAAEKRLIVIGKREAAAAARMKELMALCKKADAASAEHEQRKQELAVLRTPMLSDQRSLGAANLNWRSKRRKRARRPRNWIA